MTHNGRKLGRFKAQKVKGDSFFWFALFVCLFVLCFFLGESLYIAVGCLRTHCVNQAVEIKGVCHHV